MVFTTLTFILFLVVVFAIYWSLKARALQNIFIVMVSFFFYGWWDYRFCALLLASSLVDYTVSVGLDRVNHQLWRRLLLAFSLSVTFGILGFFKYWNFFADSLHNVFNVIGLQADFVTVNVLLPVGISFYTFQGASYVIDVYLGKMKAAPSLTDYLAYISFFPQLVAGPIERATHLLPQFLKSRSFNYSIAVDGCRQILWGFFKKMVVADNLAKIADLTYDQPESFRGPALAFGTVAFAFQIYCDFSGYSDIAIGTARLFGFDLMRNFAYPYFSQSIAEFWRRWHISLSTWLRDYIYIPLGGSRVPSLRRAWNILVTFLISGLWHGAAWTYVIWGGIHGTAILLEGLVVGQGKGLRVTDTPGGEQFVAPLKTMGRILATFALTCLAWIFFRAQSPQDAFYILNKILIESFSLSAYKGIGATWKTCPIGRGIIVVLAAFILIEWLQRRHAHPLAVKAWAKPFRWFVYSCTAWITLFWGTWSSGQFVYFQF